MSVWDQIEEVLQRNEDPLITIFPVNFIKNPSIVSSRRKLFGVKLNARQRYAHKGYLLNERGYRMRCRNRWCDNYVPVNSGSICCSVKCEQELREYCKEVLKVLDGKKAAKDFPLCYRSNRRTPDIKGLIDERIEL